MKETKTKKLKNIGKKRSMLLKKLRKMSNDKQEFLLEKIVLESEIARIDREEKEVKSESIHPYKVVIPLASFALGIFGALFIEFIKSIF